MAQIEKQERKISPDIEIDLREKDERSEIIDRLTAKNPGYSFGFHRHDVTDHDLERNYYEKVSDGSGGNLHHNGDWVVRRPIEIEKKIRDREGHRSYEMVREKLEKADKAGKLKQTASVKKPTKAGSD